MTAGNALVGVGEGTVAVTLGETVCDALNDGERDRVKLRDVVAEALVDWP